MQPLQDLLHRIKWDPEFAKGEFALGYEDRMAREERVVPFTSVSLGPGECPLALQSEDGAVAHVPLHRVRTVYRDGVAIWRRPDRGT